LIAGAASGFRRAEVAARGNQPEEVLALEVREAVESLADVLGESVGEEMLDALFARFCIGK
jgi:tRNA modification GTPase